MNVTIIHVGNLKEKYYAEAVFEYEKRLGAFCHIKNIEIKEEKAPAKPSAAETEGVISAEGERILQAIPKNSLKVALCVEGKQYSSEGLAELIGSAMKDSCFIIGGTFGLSEAVKSACDVRLSVSAMTFPHRLMRVILTEQLYRAFSINAGRAYHK